MEYLIGGVSSLHDPLLAAALRARGVAASALPTPRNDDLDAARAWLPRATPNPGLYLVGAVLRQLRALAHGRGASLEDTASGCTVVCVTGRYFHHASQHAEAWRAAGVPGLRTVALEFGRSDALGALAALPFALDLRGSHALLHAALAGDVLRVAGCAARAQWRDAPVDAAVDAVRDRCVEALEAGEEVFEALSTLPAALRGTHPAAEPGVRVRLTGDFFATMTDGDGGHRVARHLGLRGARVEPPTLAEWLLLWLWRARNEASEAECRQIARTRALVRRMYRWLSAAAGLSGALADPDDLASLARPYYPTDLLDAPGFVETGLLMAAARDQSAELVVSLKPFATTPSSAVSDALLHALAQRSTVDFLSIETNGDAGAQVASRLDLALDLAAERLRLARTFAPRDGSLRDTHDRR